MIWRAKDPAVEFLSVDRGVKKFPEPSEMEGCLLSKCIADG